MILSPSKAIENGWITLDEGFTNSDIQPNGIDLRIKELWEPRSSYDFFVLTKDNRKQHMQFTKMDTLKYHLDDSSDTINSVEAWRLMCGKTYDFVTNAQVSIPNGVAATLIVRSTLNRNQMFVTTGLYDSGYQGNVGGQLHCRFPNCAYIEPSSAIAQIVFWQSDVSSHLYDGAYNNWKR